MDFQEFNLHYILVTLISLDDAEVFKEFLQSIVNKLLLIVTKQNDPFSKIMKNFWVHLLEMIFFDDLCDHHRVVMINI